MSTQVDCPAPWCRELMALLRHGPVRIHPEMDELRVKGYLVVHVDDRARDGYSFRGQGPTLKDAIDDVVMHKYPAAQVERTRKEQCNA